jgi:Trk K+ transport system NAD-binding subunit
VSDLPLPKRARLVALVRDDEVRIVDQDTKVEAEDLLLVAVPDRKVLDATVQALAPEREES